MVTIRQLNRVVQRVRQKEGETMTRYAILARDPGAAHERLSVHWLNAEAHAKTVVNAFQANAHMVSSGVQYRYITEAEMPEYLQRFIHQPFPV